VVETVWEILEKGDYEGFLERVKMPDGMTFKEIGEEKNSSLGLVTMKQGGVRVSGVVFHAEFEPKRAVESLRNLFEDPRILKTTVADLYAFNVLFLKSENSLNDFFKEYIAELRKEPGFPNVPYSTVTVDYLDAEQFHKLRDDPRVYTMGVRTMFLVDGRLPCRRT